MLALSDKVLVIVLLHSLKSTTQTSTMLYPSTYWKTTYNTDKVPDYWNHGIYAPKLPKSEKEDIFPAWLVKTTTKSSRQITVTGLEDYNIEIVKRSTDKVLSINNAEIEKVTETLKADLAGHTTMPTTDWTELTSNAPRVTRTVETKADSIMINSIVAATPPTSETNVFTHHEHGTTIDEYDDADDDTFVITMAPSVLKSTSESISNSIINKSTYTTAPTKSEQSDFTRPEFETSLDDDDTNSPLITVNTSTITSAEKSISDSIISDIYIATTPKSKKKGFTRPVYETTIDDDNTHRPLITIKPSAITPTEESRSESIITESKTTQRSEKKYITRPEYETTINDAPQLTTNNPSLIVTIEETQSNSITTDSILTTTAPPTEYETPNYTEITQQTSSPEYDTTFFYYDANLNKPQKSSTLEFVTTVLDDESQPTSTTMTLSSSNPYETTLNYARSISTRMTQETTSITEYDTTVHNYGSQPDAVSMTQPKSLTTPDRDTKNDDNDANYLSKIMTLPSISYDTKFARLKRARTTRKIPKYVPTKVRKWTKKKLSKTTRHISSAKAVTVIRAVNKEVGSDQFSVFLRKLLILLAVKRLEDLPLLINQFKEYLWLLLTSGQIGKLGLDINSFLAQKVMELDTWPVKAVRKLFDTLQKKLGSRNRELAKDINDILEYMDDTYDEAEEEAMQAVLHEASLFPNSKNYNKLAQGFVDYVFLHPMQRVMGTTRGNVLFGMIIDALKLRDSFKEEHKIPPTRDLRKNLHFRKIRKHLHQLSDISSDKPLVNKSYERKIEDSEDKSDSNSDKLCKNSKTAKSPNGVNEYEHSDKTEGSKETIESKYYGYKNNANIVARNGAFHHRKQHRAFTNENKVRKSFSKLRTLRYLMKTKLDNKQIPQHIPRKHSRQTTANSANVHETTDSSNIEMELKAKIYETFRRMNLVNNNPSRRMRQGIKSTVNVKDDSYEDTDVERVLKNNIYKAVKKLLN